MTYLFPLGKHRLPNPPQISPLLGKSAQQSAHHPHPCDEISTAQIPHFSRFPAFHTQTASPQEFFLAYQKFFSVTGSNGWNLVVSFTDRRMENVPGLSGFVRFVRLPPDFASPFPNGLAASAQAPLCQPVALARRWRHSPKLCGSPSPVHSIVKQRGQCQTTGPAVWAAARD